MTYKKIREFYRQYSDRYLEIETDDGAEFTIHGDIPEEQIPEIIRIARQATEDALGIDHVPDFMVDPIIHMSGDATGVEIQTFDQVETPAGWGDLQIWALYDKDDAQVTFRSDYPVENRLKKPQYVED